MTLFGFCPKCGYPWYCMCDTCKKDAPELVKDWEESDMVKDGVKCPQCGEIYNYDHLAFLCEEIEPNMIETMRKMCNGCTRPCSSCPIAKFVKPERYYSKGGFNE